MSGTRTVTLKVPPSKASKLVASEQKVQAKFYVYWVDEGKKVVLTPTPCPSLGMAEAIIAEMTLEQQLKKHPYIKVTYDLKYEFGKKK